MLKFENILNFLIQTVISIDVADVFISNYVYQFFKAFGYKMISTIFKLVLEILGKIGIYKSRTKVCPETPVFTLPSVNVESISPKMKRCRLSSFSNSLSCSRLPGHLV